jgi:hypothetical protein
MKNLLLSVVGMAALATGASAQVTFLGSAGGRDYYYNATILSYTDARTFAQAFGGSNPSYLLSINSAAEQAFINSLVPHQQGIGPVYWIGLNRESNPGGGQAAFAVWDSGEAVTFTNWAGGIDFSLARDYASGNWNTGGEWLPLTNSGGPFSPVGKPSIIEVVPAPGALALLGLGALAAARRRR